MGRGGYFLITISRYTDFWLWEMSKVISPCPKVSEDTQISSHPPIKCNATATMMAMFVMQISELQNMKQALVVAANTKVLDSIIEAIAKVMMV